jgi:hypothetical protein
MSFPRYPKYKASGVEWLGDVPAHWRVVPLKSIATHNDDVLDEATPPGTELLYVDISSVDESAGITTKGDVPPNVEIEQRSSASSRSIRGHVNGAIELGVVSA